jgi:hypothetical protein
MQIAHGVLDAGEAHENGASVRLSVQDHQLAPAPLDLIASTQRLQTVL